MLNIHFYKKTWFFSKKVLTNAKCYDRIYKSQGKARNGGIAQLARAIGSYPIGHGFKSSSRYHFGPLVKRLRHGPFTAVTWVRFPYGSPKKGKQDKSPAFSFLRLRRDRPTQNAMRFEYGYCRSGYYLYWLRFLWCLHIPSPRQARYRLCRYAHTKRSHRRACSPVASAGIFSFAEIPVFVLEIRYNTTPHSNFLYKIPSGSTSSGFSFLTPTCIETSTRLGANRLTFDEKYDIINSPINKNLMRNWYDWY